MPGPIRKQKSPNSQIFFIARFPKCLITKMICISVTSKKSAFFCFFLLISAYFLHICRLMLRHLCVLVCRRYWYDFVLCESQAIKKRIICGITGLKDFARLELSCPVSPVHISFILSEKSFFFFINGLIPGAVPTDRRNTENPFS